MKRLWIFLACLLPLSAFAQAPTPDSDTAIRAVVEAFRTAIIDKDKARFVALFVPGNVGWQSTRSDAALQRVRVKNPKAVKTRFNPESTYLTFIDDIVGDKESTEETFDNVRIETDGDIASVVFDYRFIGGGVESNNGKEAWQLIRTDEGWRIISVIWSVNLPPEPAKS